jgi:hypothetical protein
MQTQPLQSKHNPLANFMRQPKIYIKLPSKGEYWPAKSLEKNENGDYPVYSMTARDELLFKTPDALMNGQALVDVIQSCVPNIKNAWDIPTIDIDTILIAIRFATYGEHMTFAHKIPVINEEVEYDLDLRLMLDKQQQNQWIEEVYVNEQLSIFVRPLTYKHMTQTSIKGFETQRIMNMVNDESISDEQKMQLFSTSFINLTKVSIDLMSDSIYKITTPDGAVTDTRFIKEFINNADKDIFSTVQNHLTDLKNKNDIQPLEFTTTEEQQTLGAPATYSLPVSFNNSDFFG